MDPARRVRRLCNRNSSSVMSLLRGLWNGDVNVDVGFVQGVGPLPVLISRRARLLRSAASRSSGAANITNIRSG